LDIDCKTLSKKSREDGGLYDGDLAVRAAQAALENANVDPREIDVVVWVSCTPDTNYCWDNVRYLWHKLGFRQNAIPDFKNLGCAGLAMGLHAASTHLMANGSSIKVLLIASNSPSSFMSRESLEHYTKYSNKVKSLEDFSAGWSWTSPAVFGDGAAAMILQLNNTDERGLLASKCEVHPEYGLISVPGGGALNHTRVDNVWQHLFLMNAPLVGEVYGPLMQRNFQMLQAEWSTMVEPTIGHSFNIDSVARWYFHQANGLAVLKTADNLGIPRERVPLNISHLGNTSAASTLILFDEDRRAGRIKEGDIAVFSWIGAGVGAMNGYAVFAL
jgi:3-oxoacyl-[acyl-carrier-protein] synthase-3